ncbi:MAG: hypothetical protein H0Z40_11365 [Desulfotomaculum sp.]|nr:hypothetical protein [Desulfotomaculum sp.]
MVFGLLVLDERDDQVIMALRISPVPIKKYIGYRVVLAFALNIAYILAFIPLSGLTARSITIQVLPAAVLAGLFSIIVLSLMGAFASNKVKGLALMKAMGILMLGPLAAYFIESKWQILLGVLPSYWPAKAFWLMYEGQPYLLYLLAGFIYKILLLYWLYRKFQIKLARI